MMRNLFLIPVLLAVAAGEAVAAEVPYVRSSVPNVWVRSVPDPKPPMVPGPAQVIVLPGGTEPTAPAVSVAAPSGIYSRSFDLPGGGRMAYVPPEYFPYYTATIGPDGNISLICVESATPEPRLSLIPPSTPKQGAK